MKETRWVQIRSRSEHRWIRCRFFRRRHRLHRSIQIIVGLLPGHIVHLFVPKVFSKISKKQLVKEFLPKTDVKNKVTIGLLSSLGIQLGTHLILQVDDVFRQILLLLLHLLQGVGDVLHPTVVVLQSLLDVTDVKPQNAFPHLPHKMSFGSPFFLTIVLDANRLYIIISSLYNIFILPYVF